MTDEEKVAKINEIETVAWEHGWTKWTSEMWVSCVCENLEIIELCQRIRVAIQHEAEGR